MAERDDDPTARPDPNRVDAVLSAAFKRVEQQPAPQSLKDHMDRLTTETRGKRRD